MSKQKFFVDFDGTIVASTKAFTNTYNILYQDHPDFKPANYKNVSQYNFKCQCPLVENPLDIFEHELFFRDLEFINDNTFEVLEKLSNKYQLILATIGTPLNLAYKSLWLENKLPFIKDYILLRNNGCKMNKSVVNMDSSIFVDDIPSNLESSNADAKILFGKLYPWNSDWKDEHCLNWSVIEERFL